MPQDKPSTPPLRAIWQITGTDRLSFLNNLVSNDLTPLEHASGIIWTALLTPQGKYLADFFVVRLAESEDWVIDIAQSLADDVLRRLTMYKLRANVEITPHVIQVVRGIGPAPHHAFPDPRHAALGWRAYLPPTSEPLPPPITPPDWDAIRVAHCIPETAIELIPNETYILEAGFERLNGVSFTKGCYVGQETTARMKHKTALKKGLTTLKINGQAPNGCEIMAQDKVVGRVFTQSNGQAIAYIRQDRLSDHMTAGEARLFLPTKE